MKYANKAKLEKDIEEYFVLMDTEGRPYTISGLACHLDTSRETLMEYQEKEEYVDTIKRAKEKCLRWVEENHLMGKVNPTAGIFNLKNNYGWRDQQHTDITSNNEKLSFGWVDPSTCTSPSPTSQDN